jgi:CRP-like cAMP-binding protein
VENVVSIAEKLKRYNGSLPSKDYAKGQQIIMSSDIPDDVFFIEEGYVRMYTISLNIHELTIHIFGPGAVFSLIACIGGVNNHFFYEAFTSAKLTVIPQEIFKRIIDEDPLLVKDINVRLLKGLAKLSLRLGQAYYSTASHKVISTLFYFGKVLGNIDNNRIFFQESIKHEDIANFAGLSRENTSRILKDLQKKGLIELKYRHVGILDVEKLKEEIERDQLIKNCI